jgi:hypothetical protein
MGHVASLLCCIYLLIDSHSSAVRKERYRHTPKTALNTQKRISKTAHHRHNIIKMTVVVGSECFPIEIFVIVCLNLNLYKRNKLKIE